MPSYSAEYQRLFEVATEALTAAPRRPRPVLMHTWDGQWIEDLMGRTEQSDWAEFVTLALAGAAARYGGVEPIFGVGSGSWEAEVVQSLLTSTVGYDEASLRSYRSGPVRVTLNVDELLAEHSLAHAPSDAAMLKLDRRAGEVPEPA